MGSYRSTQGREAIRRAVRSLYDGWPLPVRECEVPNEELGPTFCLEMGPPEAMPLVLLHGSGSNSASWMGYAPLWASRFRVIALDIPGQPGLSSEHRPGLADGSIRRWLHATLDRLGVQRCLVCGMSLGSWIALDYAINSPGRIGGLCLITTGGIAPTRKGFLLKAMALSLLGKPGVRRINRIVHGPVPVDPGVEAFSYLVSRHHVPLTEPLPLFSDDELSSLEVPLLYLGGTEDALLDTASTADRLGALVPTAQVEVLEDTGHVILEQGERILEFFEGVPERSTAPVTPCRRSAQTSGSP